jgi:hypothetical protein
MSDLVFLAATCALFALALVYTKACDALKGGSKHA